MILVPEIQTVLILTPRTGTRALKRAIAERYPQSTLLYRHMEADGVPQGYDRWRKLGVVRDPAERLWSLYKYLKRFGIDFSQEHDAAYTAAQRASVERPFKDWLLHNEKVFTSPYDSTGQGRFFAPYTVRHPLPENRKSQFIYLRPDLGTGVVPYRQVAWLFHQLDVDPPRINGSHQEVMPAFDDEMQDYLERWFAWDLTAAAA